MPMTLIKKLTSRTCLSRFISDEPLKRGHFNTDENGFTLVEFGLFLALSTVVGVMVAREYSASIDNLIEAGASDHFQMVEQAANSYVQDHYAAFAGDQVLTTQDLIDEEYLPEDFGDGAYGYKYEILVDLIDTNGDGNTDGINALVVGGERTKTVKPEHISGMAAKASGRAGVFSDDGDTVFGNFGSYEVDYSDFPASSLNDLEIASLLHFDDLSIENDYLYRKEIDGRPEFNRMETDIDMNGNDIKNVGTLFGEDVDVTGDINADGTVRGGFLHSEGDILADGNIEGQDLYANGNVEALGDVNGEKIIARDQLQAPRFVDSDDTSYVVDPDDLTALKNLSFDDAYVNNRAAYLSDLLPNYVQKSGYIVSNNSTVTKPTCGDGGIPKIMVISQRMLIGRNEAYGAVNTYATNLSSTAWQVHFTTWDYATPTDGGSGLAFTYCYYAS